METLGKKAYKTDLPKEFRDTYKYANGATYIGEWVGGFRDGLGCMTWSDGASY